MNAIILFGCIVCGLIGLAMGNNRKVGPVGGFFLGLLLGVIGLIIVAVSPRVDNEWQQDYEANKGIADSYARINEETVKKATAADELKKWYDLKEAGAITDAEYESKKSNIMK